MGRSIYCSTCKAEKEESVRNESQCKSCKAERNKAARIRKRLAAGKEPTRPERIAQCDACKEKQAGGISISGRCSPCNVISNRIRLAKKREEKGLAPAVKYDSSFCHVCNIPKVDGRCVPCRRRMASERNAKSREEAGKRPWGDGRPLTCFQCGAIKENREWSYCKSCQKEKDRVRWKEVIAPRVNRRVSTGLCPCGNERAYVNRVYCKECFAKQARDRRKAEKELIGYKPRNFLTKEQKRIKKHARDLVNSEIRKGFLIPQACEVCCTTLNVEAHHDDYSKPLHVRWLCVIHHREHHRTNEQEDQKSCQ